MTVTLRIHRECEAFELSTICTGGVVPVGMRGRLIDCDTSQNKAHASAHSPSVPFLPLPSARQLVARSRRILPLLSRPFSSVVVIGNTLRRLASVLLLRLSQPPRLSQGLNAIWCGLPNTRRSVFSRFQSLQKAKRCLSYALEVLSRRVSHVDKHGAKSDGKIQKAFGEIRNV